ncbi:YybS family protein [Clostridia bacterium OttesenSCG-928-F22]|nr:YybS family protein [Clostridia bacterium OttesenSCG-928-F22]
MPLIYPCYLIFAFLIIFLFIPVPFIYMACRRSVMWSAGAFIAAVFAIWLLKGAFVATFVCILCCPPIWVVSRLHMKGRKFSFETMLKSVGAYFLGAMLLIGVIFLISGQNIVDYTLDSLKTAFLSSQKGTTAYEGMVMFGHFDSLADSTWANVNTQAYRDAYMGLVDIDKITYTNRAVELIGQFLGQTLALVIVLGSLSGGVIAYCTSHKVLQKTKVLSERMPPLSSYHMPRKYGLYLVGAFLITLLLSKIDERYFLAYSLMEVIVFILYALQGVGLIMLIYSGRGGRNVGLLMVVVLLGFAPVGLSIVGMFDHLVNMRGRYIEGNKKEPPT